MKEILPYVASVVCALIAAISSVLISKKTMKVEIEKIRKQHEYDLETIRETHKNEMEKQEKEHAHQIELQKQEAENNLGIGVMNTIFTEALRMPVVQKKIAEGIAKDHKGKKGK